MQEKRLCSYQLWQMLTLTRLTAVITLQHLWISNYYVGTTINNITPCQLKHSLKQTNKERYTPVEFRGLISGEYVTPL